MAFGTNYFGGAPGGYYGQPMPDQLAQFRQAQYPQYQQAMPQQMQPQAPQQQPANNGITWVQGESGAKAYMVGAGNTVMLMDSEGDSFFIKSTDAAGMPMPLRIFDYKERTATPKAQEAPAEYITRTEFEALEAKINALLDKPKKKPVKEEAEDA